jgi:hypothetical protein
MSEATRDLSLRTIAQRLDGSGIAWAVFAGAAANAYGATRPLTDVDILVPRAAGARVAALFPEAAAGLREDGSVEILQMPGYDILAGLGIADLDREMAARLTRHKIMGVSVPVIPPEDNILFKAKLGRGPEEGKHDWEDVEAMMGHLPALDWQYVRWRAEAYFSPQERESMLRRLEGLWLKCAQQRKGES